MRIKNNVRCAVVHSHILFVNVSQKGADKGIGDFLIISITYPVEKRLKKKNK